jgi:protein involved in polysaccharide export with SLBB domain
MQKGFYNIVFHLCFIFTLLFSQLFTSGQPPRVIPNIQNLPSNLPAITNPKDLTNAQLEQMLKADAKDVNAGKDMLKNDKVIKDTILNENNKNEVRNSISTYGSNVFSNAPNMSISELSTPPLDYPIGVGDKIIISLYGGAELQESYTVGTDGAIFPKQMGKIYVGGLNFENARRIIYARFSSVVPAGTNIDVVLGQPRTINVNVVNEVKNPGSYTVSAFSNAYNVIAKAGGVTEYGNLRSILIKRNGRIIEEIDVYKFLQSGDVGRQLYLQNNDFIIVQFYDKKVLATGQFRRPMYYQLKKEEGVKALLKFSGGLNSDALASSLDIIRNVNESQNLINVNANAILRIAGQDELLKDGDIVKANLIKTGLVNKVEIKGEIKYPDVYQLKSGDRLFDIINRAGGVTRNTLLKRAYIFRGAGDSTNLKTSDKLDVDLSDINGGDLDSKNNIILQPNDLIQLFAMSEFQDESFVEIFGEVRKEQKVRKYGGMTLQDLLYLSGGIKQSAEFGRLEISSIVDMDSAKQGLKPTRADVLKYSINANLNIDSLAATIILKPYDQVFVRKNPTFELQQNVEIKGLVKYPGLYPRLDKYEKLSSYIARAGGIMENANLSGAVLLRNENKNLREKVVGNIKYDSIGNVIKNGAEDLSHIDDPISIDLYKALKNKNSKYDIILQKGDVIFIPEVNPFVTIKGRVQSPLRITFDKEHTSLPYYIDKAGGFGIRPWRNRIYVTYANGKSRRTRNFFFLHFYPKIDEGAVITIPVRPEGQEIADIAKSTVTSLVPILLTAIIFKFTK